MIPRFSRKVLRIVSPPKFMFDFSMKMFLMSYSINWPNYIAWLHFLLEILAILWTAIISETGCDAIKSEINPIFLIELFFYMIKNSRQKFKYLAMKTEISWNENHCLSFLKSCQMSKIFVPPPLFSIPFLFKLLQTVPLPSRNLQLT